jgi:nitrogen regulatory protein P-II 2
METTPRLLLTVIAEAVLESRLIAEVKACGAKGYSVGHVTGEGATGRTLELNGPSVRLETVVTPAVADAILDALAERFFERFAVVAWLSEVRVARPDHF